MTSDHNKDNSEHLDICIECRQEEARRCAYEIALSFAESMRPILDSCAIDDDHSLFQGEVCQLVAAYILCHSLRILKDNNVPKKMQREMLENTIEITKTFEKTAKFYKTGETH